MCVDCGNVHHVGEPTGGLGSGPAWDGTAVRGGTGANGKPSLTTEEAGVQIGRPNLTWGDTPALGDAATVTYAFRSTIAEMPNGTEGFARFDAAQIAQAEAALQSWSDVANLTFQRVGTGTSGPAAFSNKADILFSNYTAGAPDAAAFAYYPGRALGGDVFVNVALESNAAPAATNYGRLTLVHEIGHAIGLAHPGDYDAGAGAPSYALDAAYFEDSRQYSVMSYWSETNTGASHGGVYASAPLLDDIAALQRLYGANSQTRTGNDTYGFHSNTGRDASSASDAASRLVFSVWDAGGTDTFDFSLYRQNQRIDLNEGAFSDVGGLRGNVSIAQGVVIENALGGFGDDVVRGNDAGNVLHGRYGDDTLIGGGGADDLYGGTGADTFRYEALSDSAPGARDRIFGFQSGEDRIDLSAMLADPRFAAGPDLLFVDAFTGAGREATMRYEAGINRSFFFVDADGDMRADFSLLIAGRAAETDFIL